MALKRIKAGESVRPLTIEKIKGSENDQFIAILSTEAICVDLIYLPEFKTTFYFDDLMGDSTLLDQIYTTGSKPRRLYILPCAKYSAQDINQGGRIVRVYGGPMELSYIAVTEFDYKEQIIGMINDAEAAGANVMSFDIKVHTQKNGEFNQLKYTFVSPNRSAWRELPNGEALVREMIMEFDAKIELSLAMHVDLKTFIPRWEKEHPEFAQKAAITPPRPAAAPQLGMAVAPQLGMAAAPQLGMATTPSPTAAYTTHPQVERTGSQVGQPVVLPGNVTAIDEINLGVSDNDVLSKLL